MANRDEIRELLKEMEWDAYTTKQPVSSRCPICGAIIGTPHSDDCKLAQFLALLPKEQPCKTPDKEEKEGE